MKRLSILMLAAAGLFILSRCDSTSSTTKYQVSISAVPSEGGSVSPSGGKYKEGNKLDITAAPADSSWQFERWSGDYEGTSPSATITVMKAMNIKAHFSRKEYNLTIHTEGEGSVDQKVLPKSSAAGYKAGTVVQLTAKPDSGWKFVKWKGDLSGTDNPAQITVKEPKKVTAVFEKKSYALTVNVKGEGAVNQKVIQNKTGSATNYDYGTLVQLTANPVEGWKFVKWKGDLSGTKNPEQVRVKEPKEVTAVFEKSYKLTIHTTGKGSILKSPDQSTYKYKTNVELTAKPDKGWKFVKWKGDISSTDSIVQITMDKPKDVTVVFKKAKYIINALTEGNGSIKYLLPHPLYYGDIVQFVADADKGNIFVKWEGDLSGSKNPQSLRIKGNTSVTAIFKTYEEELVSILETDPPEGDPPFFISKVRVTLINLLPGNILLKKVIIEDEKGNIAYKENYKGEMIYSYYGFKLASDTPVKLSNFLRYTIEWTCEYEGEEFVKKGSASYVKSSKSAAKTRKPTKTIHIDFNKKK